MRRTAQVKPASNGLPRRKSALTASAASRRPYPAWIDAGDGAAFSTRGVTPRVRDAFVLRVVPRTKTANPRSATDGPGAR